MTTALNSYWHHQRRDNFSTATPEGNRGAREAGYIFSRREAYLYPSSAPGVVPLKSYYNSATNDNLTSATSAGEEFARAHNYDFVRVEGYIKPDAGPGSVPLKQFWSEERQDSFLTGTAEGEAGALSSGYKLLRIEGYGTFIPPVRSATVHSAIGQVIAHDAQMTTTVSVTSDGRIDAVTETLNLAVFWGYRGGVVVFFSDANELAVQNLSFSRTYGVDGTAIGRSRRKEPWTEIVPGDLASRIERIHIFHFIADDVAKNFTRAVEQVRHGVAAATEVVKLIATISAGGGAGK